MLLSFPRSMTGINYQWSLIRGNSACLDTWLFYGFPPLLAEEGFGYCLVKIFKMVWCVFLWLKFEFEVEVEVSVHD